MSTGNPTFGPPAGNKKEPIQPAEEEKVEKPIKKSFEVIENSLEEYGDVETLFLMENLSENFDMVEEQMNNIRKLIIKYNKAREAHKKDPDMDIYVDEYSDKIENSFTQFTINGKIVNIRELYKGRGVNFEDIFNDIIIEINNYIEHSMIGSGKQFLQQI